MSTGAQLLLDTDDASLEVARHLGWAEDLCTSEKDRIHEQAEWICQRVLERRDPWPLPDGTTLHCTATSSLLLGKGDAMSDFTARTATIGQLKELRATIHQISEEREEVLMLTVAEISRREQAGETIRALLPEADMALGTYYARSATAARFVPSGEALADLRARRLDLEHQLEASKAERNQILIAAPRGDLAAFSRAAGVTPTWVRMLKRTPAAEASS